MHGRLTILCIRSSGYDVLIGKGLSITIDLRKYQLRTFRALTLTSILDWNDMVQHFLGIQSCVYCGAWFVFNHVSSMHWGYVMHMRVSKLVQYHFKAIEHWLNASYNIIDSQYLLVSDRVYEIFSLFGMNQSDVLWDILTYAIKKMGISLRNVFWLMCGCFT